MLQFYESLCLLLTLYLVVVVVDSRTIDLFEAIVREPPENNITTPDDLFGYSAALHNTIDPYISSDFQAKISGAQ